MSSEATKAPHTLGASVEPTALIPDLLTLLKRSLPKAAMRQQLELVWLALSAATLKSSAPNLDVTGSRSRAEAVARFEARFRLKSKPFFSELAVPSLDSTELAVDYEAMESIGDAFRFTEQKIVHAEQALVTVYVIGEFCREQGFATPQVTSALEELETALWAERETLRARWFAFGSALGGGSARKVQQQAPQLYEELLEELDLNAGGGTRFESLPERKLPWG